MAYCIKNWAKFQHFKDRKPPWIKLYRDLLDDPDWHELNGDDAKALVMLWLIASEDVGQLPEPRKVAFRLRISLSKCEQLLNRLSHWLYQDDIKPISDGYQVDAPEREKERETETETEKIGAPAPQDPRADLFGRGAKALAEMTGKTPDSCRALIGRLLKIAEDDAQQVLGAIDDAQQNRIAHPASWLTKVLQNAKSPNGRSREQGKSDLKDALREVGEYIESSADGNFGQAVIRSLPSARHW